MQFEFNKQSIPDVILINHTKFGDHRGFFLETFREDIFKENGMTTVFLQENKSLSHKGVLRGLHYQMNPHAQGKLVEVHTGAVLDIAVDIRHGSPTYGKHVAVTLTGDDAQALWVPPGFAHGFLTLEDNTLFSYKTTNYYHPDSERAILWRDTTLGIKWPDIPVTLADKDKNAPCFNDAENNFTYDE